MPDPIRTTELSSESSFANVESFLVNTTSFETRRIAKGAVPGAAGDAHAVVSGNPHGTTAAHVGADPAGTAAAAVTLHEGASNPHPGYANPARITEQQIIDATETGVVLLAPADVKRFMDIHGAANDEIDGGSILDTADATLEIDGGSILDG